MKRASYLIVLPSVVLLALSTADAENVDQALKALPDAVQKTIGLERAQGQLVSIEQKPKDGVMRYKVVLTVRGRTRKLTVDANGRVLKAKEDLALEGLPASVRRTIDAQGRDARIEHAAQITKESKLSYEVQINVNGHKKEVVVEPSGEVTKIEEMVPLSSIPAAARGQLEKIIGHAKVVEVEAITEKGQITAYEANVELDGHKSEIKVAPDGRVISRE